MKIEDQVVSRLQAEKLSQLGINYDSTFIHVRFLDDVNLNDLTDKKWRWDTVFTNWNLNAFKEYQFFHAYTVAELGLMLPRFRSKQGYIYELKQWRNEKTATYSESLRGFLVNYDCEKNGDRLMVSQGFPTEAEARAAMLIHLLENNLTTATEVNQRL